jgi:RND superfamily putative drug exporter
VTAAVVTAGLLAGALGTREGREPLSFADAFRDPPESVAGERLIADRFVPGRTAPVRFVTDFEAAPEVVTALTGGADTPVAEMQLMAGSEDGRRSGRPSELGLSEAFLRFDPFSDEATEAVPALRARARDAANGTPVLVGGEVAEAYDTRQALARDTWLVVPLSLGLILVILAVLLRAVVMPLYVMGTVILSFGFAMGASSLLFTHVFDQPGSDPGLPLFAFIFLVALGVDYNVFLLARIREEREDADTGAAVTAALARTGGVITSAGLVLAATFAVLMALELEALFQIGFVVALGLLADTFLVRALLVPSLAILLGERNWWPAGSSVVATTKVR